MQTVDLRRCLSSPEPVTGADPGSSTAARDNPAPGLRIFAAFASGSLLLAAWLYWPVVPPGSDGDANAAYQVMVRLLETFQYRISRTPGQPALDLMNTAAFSLGGNAGLAGTYLCVCLLGIIAFYRICSARDAQYPFFSAAGLLLLPHFVAHVTGLGDFSVSLSLFLICLYLLGRRRHRLAALAFITAIGFRLSYCLFVLPLMYYIYHIEREAHPSGAPYGGALKFALISTLGSLCLFAPLFGIYGLSLFHNLGWQSFSYHASSFLYKLISRGLGVPLSLLVAALIVAGRLRTSQQSAPVKDRWFDTFLLMIMLVTLVIFFFIPTKPEILMPLLAALLLYLGRHFRRPVMVSALIAIIFLGIVHVDLRDPSDDSLALRFSNGLYFEAYAGAYENRYGGEAIREALARLPSRTVLVTNLKQCYPRELENSHRSADRPRDLQSCSGALLRPPMSSVAFPGLEGRYVVSFQDDSLKGFLENNALMSEPDRYTICYDPRYAALTRRWQKVDPSRFGSPVTIRNGETGPLPPNGLTLFRLPSFPSWFRGLPKGT